MCRILVTGANGFVGNALLKSLVEFPYEITVLDRQPSNIKGVRSLVADISQPLQNLPDDLFDIVIHLAGATAHAGISESLLWCINVNGTQHVLEKFLKASGHVIFFSTGLVYGPSLNNATEADPLNPMGIYEKSKSQAEQVVAHIAETRKATYTLFRPSVIYGSGAPAGMFIPSLISALQKGIPFPMTSGDQLRDFIHIDDVTQAIVLSIKTKLQGIFNLSYGKAYTLSEIADFIGNIHQNHELIQKGALPYRENESFTYSLCSDKLKTTASWSPQTSINKGILALWNSTQPRNTP